jgi:hypothetical protein
MNDELHAFDDIDSTPMFSTDFPDAHVPPPVIPWDEQGHLTLHLDQPVIGSPVEWSEQTTGFTCAVVSQEMILNAFGVRDPSSGLPISEARLVYDATSHGWLTDGGTNLGDMGRLLDLYGVHSHHGAGLPQALEELGQGHKVIVGVDADELWHSDNWILNGLKDLMGKSPNHALVLEEVRMNEQGHAVVVVADPGDPNGAHREYPLTDFENAFADSGFHYVATDDAPPGFSPDAWLGARTDSEQPLQDDWQHWLRIVGRTATGLARFTEHGGIGKATVVGGAALVSVATLSKEKRREMMRRI